MCEPISIGIAIGASTGAVSSAVTGGDVLQGALMGGVMGGIGGAFLPPAPGLFGSPFTTGIASEVGGFLGASTVFNSAIGMSAAQAVGMGAIGLTGGIAMGMLTPQQADYNQSVTGMPYTPQAYNTQHTKVTGSGGRQAAAVLASEMKRAKSLRSRQAGAEDYGLGMDVTGTGLQIA